MIATVSRYRPGHGRQESASRIRRKRPSHQREPRNQRRQPEQVKHTDRPVSKPIVESRSGLPDSFVNQDVGHAKQNSGHCKMNGGAHEKPPHEDT